MNLVLRCWDVPIPIACEFRGVNWPGALHTVCQYFDLLRFPELKGLQEVIARDPQAVFAKLQDGVKALLPCCILDFAWLGPGNVQVIEINPFEVCLRTMGLFCWTNPADNLIITEGPFELRRRNQPLTEEELEKAFECCMV